MLITIKAARINAGMTLDDAAKATGIAKSTISNYETGKTSPKMDNAKALVVAYGVSMEKIRW